MLRTYDVLIVGSGPAGLWAANSLASLTKSKLNIAILEKGQFSSGGLINDCKLNLTSEIGMNLEELKLKRNEAETYIKDIDKKFVELGADPHLYGTDEKEINEWVQRASRCGAELIPCKQRHIGTDMSKGLVQKFKNELENDNINFHLKTQVFDIEKEKKERFILKTNKGIFKSKFLIVAPGRIGAYWFRSQARKLGINHKWGPIDIGVRVELLSEVYDPITDVIYDPKFKFITKQHKDRTRTFCTNKGGKVRIERFEEYTNDNSGDNHNNDDKINNGFFLVNGDALKRIKTQNTNFAILNTMDLTEPYGDTTEMGRSIAKETNRLGGGLPIVQRMGDFIEGNRSKLSSFFRTDKKYDILKPTLQLGASVVPGDISLAYRGRIVDNIRDTLDILDRIIPGVMHPSTLLYAPEIKFYDTRYPTTNFLETNLENLFVAGDGVGKSRGIIGAALTGILAAKGIIEKM